MKKIFHIVPGASWNPDAEEYKGDTLAKEGFIHCSTEDQLIEVADYIFKGREDLLLLVIDEAMVTAEIKYEDAGNGKFYPHIYGPLNTDAVTRAVAFKPEEDGMFTFPSGL